MNKNISNEFNISDVHGAGRWQSFHEPKGFIHFVRDPLWFIAP